MLKFLAAALWIGTIRLCNKKIHFLPNFCKRSIHWLHSITLEIFFVVVSLVIRPWGYLRDQSRPFGFKAGTPILLVHGYLHDSSAWAYMIAKLKKQGLGPVYTLNLKHPFLSIREYAKKVEKKTEEIEHATGKKELFLVGHSMGGLVSSWYATHLAEKGKIAKLVTIGSPLKGTYLAHIALGPNGREMKPKSTLIQELEEALSKDEMIDWYHIGTRTDQLVIPHTSSYGYQEKAHRFLLEDIGHVTMLFSPRVASRLTSWLNTEK